MADHAIHKCWAGEYEIADTLLLDLKIKQESYCSSRRFICKLNIE